MTDRDLRNDFAAVTGRWPSQDELLAIEWAYQLGRFDSVDEDLSRAFRALNGEEEPNADR